MWNFAKLPSVLKYLTEGTMYDIIQEAVDIVDSCWNSPSPILTVKTWQVPVSDTQARNQPEDSFDIYCKLIALILAVFFPRVTSLIVISSCVFTSLSILPSCVATTRILPEAANLMS